MRRDQRSPEAEVYRRYYKKARWKNIRHLQLQKEPLCERCAKQGRDESATVCHHKNAEDKKSAATFYRGPFESLCAPHHDGEAQSEERKGYISTAMDEYGWPTDPRHPANTQRI